MKKLFAVLLAVAMLLSLGVTAFASGDTVNAKIVIADAPAGVSYVAYKLFDATTTTDAYNQEKLSYTVSDPWFSLLFDKDDDGNITPKDPAIKFKVTPAAGESYNVEAEEGYSPADFAKWIMTNVTEWPDGAYTGVPDATTGVCEITGEAGAALPQGYYLIAPAKQIPGTVTPGTTNFAYKNSPTAWTSAYDWSQLPQAEKDAYEVQENACYYEKNKDQKIPVTPAYYNTLSAEQQENYELGNVYTHRAEITEAVFRGLSKASQNNYTASAINYSRTAATESISATAWNAIQVSAKKDLYEAKDAHYLLVSPAVTDPDTGEVTTPAEYSTTDFVLHSAYELMDPIQQAQYNPTATDAYVTLDTITPAQYLALGQSDDDGVRALQANYTGVPTADTQGQASTIPDSTQTASLANVLDGQITQVVNKNDMPLDKEVNNAGDGTEGDDAYNDNGTGVKVGDVLEYQISTKVPAKYDPDKYDYIFQVSDKMSKGLTFGKEITIHIGDVNNNGTADDATDDYYPIEIVLKVEDDGTLTQTVKRNNALVTGEAVFGAIGEPFELVTTDKTLGGNELRLDGEDEIMGGNFTFELSIATASQALRQYAGQPLLIEYSATVNEEALGALLKNAAVLEYTDETGLHELDAETDNYLARIVIDKFETGNRSQKLAGAEFVLYTYVDANNEPLTDPALVAQAIANGATPKYYKLTDGDGDSDAVVSWEDTEGQATRAITDANGFAQFPYLPDGIYYLKEVKAPIDYTRLLNDIEFVINGKDALDQRLTQSQAEDILSQVANVANTPGSSMPSTGGVGATMMTIGGVALILAAGAFLVLRRRKEQE